MCLLVELKVKIKWFGNFVDFNANIDGFNDFELQIHKFKYNGKNLTCEVDDP